MMLESRALAERGGPDGTGSAAAFAIHRYAAVAPRHHITVVSLDPAAALQLGWVLDVLAEANRISDAVRFTWDVLSLADYGDTARRGYSDGSEALMESRSAVFIAGDRLQVRLNELERERFRRSVRQMDLALACGAAVELFAACSLLQGQTAAACRMTSVWLREQFPGTCFRSEPLCWNGAIGTSTGGIAMAAAMLGLLDRLGYSHLSREVCGRLLLPALTVDQPGLSPRVRFGARSSKIAKAISFMQDNLEGTLSIEVVAAQAGSSVRQLERLFKVQMKTTPARFLKRLRLEQARSLLLNTELSVIQIVCATGFESPAHFSKSFKREFAVSPSKWRKERRHTLSVKSEGRLGGASPAQRAVQASAKKLSPPSKTGAGAGIVSCS